MRSEVLGSNFENWEVLTRFSLTFGTASTRVLKMTILTVLSRPGWDYGMDCAILGALHHSSTTTGPAKGGNDRAEVCFQSVGEVTGLPMLCAYL
jgi:hypothetical protein